MHKVFPIAARLRHRKNKFFEPGDDDLADASLHTVLQNSVELLRVLAPQSGCGRDDERQRVAEQLRALQYAQLCFETHDSKDVNTGQYSFHTLLTCVVQGNLLKNQAKLKQAIINGLQLAAPRVLLKELLQRLDGIQSFPSKTTIASARFCLDMAFALFMQSRLGVSDLQVTFLWVDSSPQGGGFSFLNLFSYIIVFLHVKQHSESVDYKKILSLLIIC